MNKNLLTGLLLVLTAGTLGAQEPRDQLFFSIIDQKDTQRVQAWLRENPSASYKDLPGGFLSPGRQLFPWQQEIFAAAAPGTRLTRGQTLRGREISSAVLTKDPYSGDPVIRFKFHQEKILFQFTLAHRGESLGIIFRDRIYFHAVIAEGIPGGQVQISGFTPEEGQEILRIFNAPRGPQKNPQD